jgi:hypothetical protein
VITSPMGEFLQLSPPELRFRFELRKNIPVTLSLTNNGEERIAFKVKTTSPKKYCVRPSTGYVDPGSSKDVQVIMQAQREYPPSLNDCKDKFLVQSLKIDSKTTEITPELFEAASGKDIKQSKLRVVLVGPPKPPSPVPEGVEEEASPMRNTFKAGVAGESSQASGAPTPPQSSIDPASELARVIRDRNRLRDSLARVESDRADIKQRLDQVGQHDARGTFQAQKTLLKDGRFTVVHLAAAVFLTFILTYLLF